ncbi:MAG TPA: Nramp family divalent metal transporter [Steroidobacteraceae bacterium]|jgi:NRAMP (natural resistance-associated macrophage protein)-like metal ion transporter|nr:Nramp family divalent metal transporter [Steroidobacteraceae bacterium]
MVKLIKSLAEHPRVKQLGPGLITGAADDDPSGIATYSQAGAQFGYSMLWAVLFTYPLMVGIQMVSARLGFITGKGLAANVKAVFPRPVLYGIVALLLIANTINIAADIAAMGEALRLLLGGSAHLYSVCFGLLCLILQVLLRYQTYVRYLKWLTLTLLSYVAVIFTIHVHWGSVIREMVLPRLALDHDTITMVVAVFGTTISPYLFFWQAAQEMEDLRANHGRNGGESRLPHTSDVARRHLRRIRWDTYVGMAFSNLIAFFIILSTAATLHAAGITDIQTSAQAAEALRPLGGAMAFLLFSLGIIGTGMLAVPVLAGSAAYAVAESFDWQSGMDRKLPEALGFYGIIGVATIGGVALTFTHLDAVRALVWSAEINGIIAVPIMAVMMILASRADVMGTFVVRPRLRRLGWAATAVMAVTVVAMMSTS